MRTVSTALLLLAVLTSNSAGAPDALGQIRDHLDREMLRTASAELAAFLVANPESSEGWVMLAECRLLQSDGAAAEVAARTAAEKDEINPRLWMLWGRACFELGLRASANGEALSTIKNWFTTAEGKFLRVLELDPKDPDVRWRLGRVKEWQKLHGAARRAYAEQIEKFPSHPGGYRGLGQLQANKANRTGDGRSLESRRQRREAVATFDLGLEKAGDDAELLNLRGLALAFEGAREEPLDCYLRAIRADPDFQKSWVRAAELVDPMEVLYPLAREVLKAHPTSATAAWWAGYYAVRRDKKPDESPWGRCEEALECLLPALEKHGDHLGLYTQAFQAAQALIGKSPRRAPNLTFAIHAFKVIHEHYAWSGDAANNLGFCYREVKKYEESLAWYLKSVERAPSSQDILNDTGLIYLFHFPDEREKGLPFFVKTVAFVTDGDQKPERGYWDSLENLCKHYWEVDRQPEKVIEYAKMRYQTTKGVKPYNMSQSSARHAKLAREALGK